MPRQIDYLQRSQMRREFLHHAFGIILKTPLTEPVLNLLNSCNKDKDFPKVCLYIVKIGKGL